jgi:hypothetical protein
VPEIPRHPADEGGDRSRDSRSRGSVTSARRSTYLAWAVGFVLVVLFVVLHVFGVLGPGGH